MYKVTGLFLIIAGIVLMVFISQNPPSNSIQEIWDADQKNLAQSIPQWNSIKLIEMESSSDIAKDWIKKVKPPVPINPSGEYRMEVLFMLSDDKSPDQVIVQHHVIHISSGHSVFEVSRSYSLNP
jgi:hypothetical protein